MLCNIKNTVIEAGLGSEQTIPFATFASLSSACKAAPILSDVLARLEAAFRFAPKGSDPYLQLKIRAHFFNRANELSVLETTLESKEKENNVSSKPSSWRHEMSGASFQQVQFKSYLPTNRRDGLRPSDKSASSGGVRDESGAGRGGLGGAKPLRDISNSSIMLDRSTPRTVGNSSQSKR